VVRLLQIGVRSGGWCGADRSAISRRRPAQLTALRAEPAVPLLVNVKWPLARAEADRDAELPPQRTASV
jgi:hypothetical protein